eukprot:TRINITY_DN985_c2_g1_i1.p1 TRINITY_DN985_c2_g1~~TRINITY_DN985_c2_g1_i1.p1  ORF type:complete len:213 (-),score=12.28 TRINITY_DN985_c2_g1_i1:24-662(-)
MKVWSYGLAANHPESEDEIILLPEIGVFVVLDGHGGRDCVEIIKSSFEDVFSSFVHFSGSINERLQKTYQSLDQKALALAMETGKGVYSGACCLCCLIDSDEDSIVVANVGDCRVVIGRRSRPRSHMSCEYQAIQISVDHTCLNLNEAERVICSSGDIYAIRSIEGCSQPRVAGYLTVARSIGDSYLKIPLLSQYVHTPWVFFFNIYIYIYI